MKKEKESVRSIKSLLASYDSSNILKCKKLDFEGVTGLDVYNIASPFKLKGVNYLLGRVELRDFEVGSLAVFFTKKGKEKYWKRSKAPVFNLQDPFWIRFNGEIVIGGVEIMQKNVERGLKWRTVFYRGKSLGKLRRFAEGPWGMKGIRFVRLNGKIYLFTRPQGKKGRRGKIGFRVLNSLSELKPRKISGAGIIKGMFAKGEWGGVNQVHVLKNKKLGVLGHIAKFEKDNSGEVRRYYYPISFCFDPETEEFSGMKILACRGDLPEGDSKRKDLYHVIYPGGLIRVKGKKAKLYAGVSDVESYEITIKDPFLEYEE